MQELVLTAKALADPSRARILMALRRGELCVCELCDALRMTQSTLSTHLQVIRRAGLVSTRREGKWMYYAIAPDARPVLTALGRCFAKPLAADPVLRRDAQHLKRRLKLREKNLCCVGFDDGACRKKGAK